MSVDAAAETAAHDDINAEGCHQHHQQHQKHKSPRLPPRQARRDPKTERLERPTLHLTGRSHSQLTAYSCRTSHAPATKVPAWRVFPNYADTKAEHPSGKDGDDPLLEQTTSERLSTSFLLYRLFRSPKRVPTPSLPGADLPVDDGIRHRVHQQGHLARQTAKSSIKSHPTTYSREVRVHRTRSCRRNLVRGNISACDMTIACRC